MSGLGDGRAGLAELRRARRTVFGLLWPVFLFTSFVNVLMLTGPLFMLQVYDRVLGSHSEATLAALFGLVIFLFLIMGILDHARGRVMARAGARFQNALDARVFGAALQRAASTPGDPAASVSLRDLEAVRGLIASPVLLALLDMPWAPVFMAAVFMFHPSLGFLAMAGGILLVFTTVLNQLGTRLPAAQATQLSLRADRMADQMQADAETVLSLGMRGAALTRWQTLRRGGHAAAMKVADRGGGFATFSRTMRLFLQSAMLALGAWLVLQGTLTGGAMIATSILMGRALAPVEQAVGGWAQVQRAAEGWRRLAALLSAEPLPAPRTVLPAPRAFLEAVQLSVVPPGQAQAVLRMISFKLEPGQALGVIGPSGCGKSTLARALTGLWRPAGGTVRLDGATLEQYEAEGLGRYIGYLPQRVTLFDGSIAENIARLAPQPDAAEVVEAAKKAGAHQMILDLPDGYDTRVSQAGGRLSGGQIQRIGLSRALYGNPVLLVLDEPNSNLDNDGSEALNLAIRGVKAAGGAVLIMAHRPAAIAECDVLLVLDGGMRRAFGPRDEVLRGNLRNAPEIVRASGPGGVS